MDLSGLETEEMKIVPFVPPDSNAPACIAAPCGMEDKSKLATCARSATGYG